MNQDSFESRFSGLLKPCDVLILQCLWQHDDGVSSRDIWVHVNTKLKDVKTISPATVIHSLASLVGEGILDYTETPNKGRSMRIYSARYNEAEFKQYISERVLRNLV